MENYRSAPDYLRQKDKTRNGKGIAIEFDGNKIIREEYWRRISYYRQYFESQGFFYGCQKPVTICNLNVPEYEFIYLALLDLGAIVSTVSLPFLINNAKVHTTDKGADTIVMSIEYINHTLEKSLQPLWNKNDNKIKRIIFTSAGDYRAEDRSLAYNKQFNYKTMIASLNLPKNIEIVYPGELKEKSDGNRILTRKPEPYHILKLDATYSNTGGTTTGVPKCAVHKHEALINLFKYHEKNKYPAFPVQENDRTLLFIPISHITSQFYGMLVRRSAGATIVYNPKAFEPGGFAKALIEGEINDVVAPFSSYMALAHSELKKGDLRNLRTSLCGGEVTPHHPLLSVNERLTWAGAERLIVGAGSTEFGSATVVAYGLEDRDNECGMAVPGVDAVVIDPLTGTKALDGNRGIIYFSVPWQMDRYLNNPEATREFFNYRTGDGKVLGTNNDIAMITRHYQGKEVFSFKGRISDFVLQKEKTNKFYPGITLTRGKANPVDLKQGYYLSDMRDKLLSFPGVIEAEALIVPYEKGNKEGTLVANLVITHDVNPVDILKSVYASYTDEEIFLPQGIVFRTNFARSLATDKRDTVSLREEREGYYRADADGNIYEVAIPQKGEPTHICLNDTSKIQRVAPPDPAARYQEKDDSIVQAEAAITARDVSNIYPFDIEKIVCREAAVLESKVISLEINTEKVPVVHIVLQPDFTDQKEEVIMRVHKLCQEHLTKSQIPWGYKIGEMFDSDPANHRHDYQGMKSERDRYYKVVETLQTVNLHNGYISDKVS